MISRYKGIRATIAGLGLHGGGVAAARCLASHGARLTITDLADEISLSAALDQLSDLPLEALHLDGHRDEDFVDADLIVVNPAVPPDSRFVQAARAANVAITSEIELFLEQCPAQIVGVTGSNGKSTTAAMIAAILAAAGRGVHLGGNIGNSLLPKLDEIHDDDWVVLELSSFQLHWLSDTARRPDVAVITNLTPNHLDWHPTFSHYRQSKLRILSRGAAEQIVIAPSEIGRAGQGTSQSRSEQRVSSLRVPGNHNRQNAALAMQAAAAIGCSENTARRALASFNGLPHRLERVGTRFNRLFINDSQATTPESTIAALNALPQPMWLLVGGMAKTDDFAPLAEEIAARAAGVACYGAAGEQIARAVRNANTSHPVASVETLRKAVAACWHQSSPGDVMLLSPACASFDQYRDYADRADDFRDQMNQLSAPSTLPRRRAA